MNVGELRASLQKYDDDVDVAIIINFSQRGEITTVYSMKDFEDEGIDPMELETREYPTINIKL